MYSFVLFLIFFFFFFVHAYDDSAQPCPAAYPYVSSVTGICFATLSEAFTSESKTCLMDYLGEFTNPTTCVEPTRRPVSMAIPSQTNSIRCTCLCFNGFVGESSSGPCAEYGVLVDFDYDDIYSPFCYQFPYNAPRLGRFDGDDPSVWTPTRATIVIKSNDRCDFECKAGYETRSSISSLFVDENKQICDPSLTTLNGDGTKRYCLSRSDVTTLYPNFGDYCVKAKSYCVVQVPPFVSYTCLSDANPNVVLISIDANAITTRAAFGYGFQCLFVTHCPNADYTSTLQTTSKSGSFLAVTCDYSSQACSASTYNSQTHTCSAPIYVPDSIPVKCSVVDYTFPSLCPPGYYGQRCYPCSNCGSNWFYKCDDGKTGSGACIFKERCNTFQIPLVYNYASSTGQCNVLGGGIAISQLLQTKVFFYNHQTNAYEFRAYAIIASIDAPMQYSLYLYDRYIFESFENAPPWLCKRFGQQSEGGYVFLSNQKIEVSYIESGSSVRVLWIILGFPFTAGTYLCDCPTGTYGRTCENNCLADPSLNQICNPENGNVICNKFSRPDEYGDCILSSCPEGSYGSGCTQKCPICRDNPLLTKCDQDTGSPTAGTCQCPNYGERPNPSKTKCISIHCGPNDDCSGHKAWCHNSTTADFQFCQCPPGYHGKYCEHSSHCVQGTDPGCEETFEEQSCDCGVKWNTNLITLNSITEYTIVPSGLFTPSFTRDNFKYASETYQKTGLQWNIADTNTDVYAKAYSIENNGAAWRIPSELPFNWFRLQSTIDELKDYRTDFNPNQEFKLLEQAQYICYTDAIGCNGFMYTIRRNPVFPFEENGFFVNFFVKRPVITNNNTALMNSIPIYDQFVGQHVTSATQVYIKTIDRAYGYRCKKRSFDDFDPYYYFFESGLRSDIEDKFCPASQRDPVTNECCLKGSPTRLNLGICDSSITLDKTLRFDSRLVVQDDDPWIEMAKRHWRSEGHRKRYSPNSDCVLSPVLWASQTRCASPRPGCLQGGSEGIPCSDQGRCVRNNRNENSYPFDYKCSCDLFDSTGFHSRSSIDNLLKWTGLACQIPGADACVDYLQPVGQQTVCNGDTIRCVNITLPTGSDLTTTNPSPKCDCNMLTPSSTGKRTPASGDGSYCATSRCGPQREGCNSGECILSDSTGKWECECGERSDQTGPICLTDATPCLAQVDTVGLIQCSGRGICHEPSAPGLSNVPGFNLTSAWCECLTGNYTGSTCSSPVCDIQYLEPEHGICNGIGGDVTCYPAWTSPGTRCNTSICEPSGGTPGSRTKYEPYGICICPTGREMRTDASPGDISCWPTLPIQNGTICGGPPNTYSRDATNLNPTARTRCICSNDWKLSSYLDPITGITEQTCIKKCSVNGIWDPITETCICTPNTKWYNKPGNTRCEDKRCEPNGVFQQETQSCICNSGLYDPDSNCDKSKCSVCSTCQPVTTVPRGEVTSSNRCFCYKPYASSNPSTQLDCNSDVCGVNKLRLNPTLNGRAKCDCTGLFWTKTCGSNDAYCTTYCMDHFCTNGGYPTSSTSFTCDCPFPYKSTGTLKPYCADNICNQPYGIPIAGLPVLNGKSQPGACVCLYGFSDNPNTLDTMRCNQHPCTNGGVWDAGSLSCSCANGWKGTTCLEPTNQTLSCNSEHGFPISTKDGKSACACAPLWTGTLCQETLCEYGEYDPISISCKCQTNFVGYLCDVYIGPPTKAPSNPSTTTTPPSPSVTEPWQNQSITLFHITLAIKYWATIASVLLIASILMMSYVIVDKYALLL